MAHTYLNLQPSLSSILSGVVDDVSTALLSEIGVSVKYKHNSFTALMNELTEESVSPTLKNDKYPLIALIQPYRSKYDGKSASPNVTFDLIIVTGTTPTKTADERETESYDAILRPISAELFSQLSNNQFVSFIGMMPKVDVIDIYHLGDERGNKNGYTFPDFVDAIIIESMELKIYPEDTCISGLSLACTPIHEVELYHAITGVTLGGVIGGIAIEITITDVDLVEDTFIPSEYDFSIDMGDGVITADAIVEDVLYRRVVSQVPDGVYIGTITSSLGAIYQFEYEVRNGLLYSRVGLSVQDFEYGDLDCADSFEYPLSISYTAAGSSMNQSQITDGSGNVLVTYAYNESTNESEVYATTIESLENSYIINILTANANQLENTTILNIKII